MSRRLPFSGRYTVQLDAKRRAILPAALRKLAEKELEEKGDPPGEFYLTYYGPGRLHLYTSVGFQRQLKRMRRNVNRFENDEDYMEAKDVYDAFLHNSVNLKIGEQGRLLIPPELFDQSGFNEGESVYFVGSDEVIEIWKPSRYDEHFERMRSDYKRTETVMRNLTRRLEEEDDEDD